VKLSKNPNKIVGVILTEVSISIVPETRLKAMFHLLDNDSNVVAQAPITSGWPPAVAEAFQKLAEAMEAEQLKRLFGEEESEESAATPVVPADVPSF
jgi:hypothetical protein